MKNFLIVFAFLSLSQSVSCMEKEKIDSSAGKNSSDFFSAFSEQLHLQVINREFGQKRYGLNFSNCSLSDHSGMNLISKRCKEHISFIDLSDNAITQVIVSDFLTIFPFLCELKVNNSQVKEILLDELPENFNLELKNNKIVDIAPFIAKEKSSCNFEGNLELTEQSKRNIELSFRRPLLERFLRLEDSIKHFSDHLKYLNFLGACASFSLYAIMHRESFNKIHLCCGLWAGCILLTLTCVLIRNYYSDFYSITYRGKFKF